MTPLLRANAIARRIRGWALRWYWERRWVRADYAPPWIHRDVADEVVAAVDDGWFVAGGRALDVGCGEGNIASWLAARGFHGVGTDISAAAIARARARHGEIPGRLEYRQHDILAGEPPGGPFEILVDCGCFHTIADRDASLYARNLASACRAGARFLLFVRAFRDGVPIGDAGERARIVGRVETVFSRDFSIDRDAQTDLGARAGEQSSVSLPGLAFWLTRR